MKGLLSDFALVAGGSILTIIGAALVAAGLFGYEFSIKLKRPWG